MLTSRRQLYGVVTSLHRRPGRASAGHPPRRDAYPPFGARRWPPDPVTRMPSARHAHKQRTVVWGREAASRVRPGSDTTRSRPNRHGTTLHGLLSKIARKTLPLSLRAWAAKRTKVGEGLVPGSQRHSECSPDRRPGTGPAPAATARFHPGRHRTTLHGLLSAVCEVTCPTADNLALTAMPGPQRGHWSLPIQPPRGTTFAWALVRDLRNRRRHPGTGPAAAGQPRDASGFVLPRRGAFHRIFVEICGFAAFVPIRRVLVPCTARCHQADAMTQAVLSARGSQTVARGRCASSRKVRPPPPVGRAASHHERAPMRAGRRDCGNATTPSNPPRARGAPAAP